MTVAAQVAQGHPRRTRTQSLVCPGCGAERTVTYETYRRIVRGELSGRCRDCPGVVRELAPTDADRKFWLKSFGVPAAELRGITALAWIGEHGMPAELALVATGFVAASTAPQRSGSHSIVIA